MFTINSKVHCQVEQSLGHWYSSCFAQISCCDIDLSACLSFLSVQKIHVESLSRRYEKHLRDSVSAANIGTAYRDSERRFCISLSTLHKHVHSSLRVRVRVSRTDFTAERQIILVSC